MLKYALPYWGQILHFLCLEGIPRQRDLLSLKVPVVASTALHLSTPHGTESWLPRCSWCILPVALMMQKTAWFIVKAGANEPEDK